MTSGGVAPAAGDRVIAQQARPDVEAVHPGGFQESPVDVAHDLARLAVAGEGGVQERLVYHGEKGRGDAVPGGVRDGGDQRPLIDEECLQEVPADLVDGAIQGPDPRAVAGEVPLGDHPLLDLHRQLPLLVLLPHAAEQRDGADGLAVPPMQRADAEGNRQRPSGGGLHEDELRHRPPDVGAHAAQEGISTPATYMSGRTMRTHTVPGTTARTKGLAG